MDDPKIGSVQRVMIYKVGGKIAYAVVSFGGFGPRLGAGPCRQMRAACMHKRELASRVWATAAHTGLIAASGCRQVFRSKPRFDNRGAFRLSNFQIQERVPGFAR